MHIFLGVSFVLNLLLYSVAWSEELSDFEIVYTNNPLHEAFLRDRSQSLQFKREHHKKITQKINERIHTSALAPGVNDMFLGLGGDKVRETHIKYGGSCFEN
ncbi:MAG: hypothetical protein Alpg2KO_14610 [Alphaproteobacteria bacterium]